MEFPLDSIIVVNYSKINIRYLATIYSTGMHISVWFINVYPLSYMFDEIKTKSIIFYQTYKTIDRINWYIDIELNGADNKLFLI